ncbi:DNA polymerase III subunit delta' [Shewanella waksmanii]|uniref:DNA polymerase III subunit delta' n=1 Tax=Shewanella waksmanii TaxID=213783 RepID=UPI00373570A1
MSRFPWLNDVSRHCFEQIVNQTLGHAYLLGLHSGYGAKDFIDSFAQAALCAAPTVNGACGQCKSCLLIAAGNHPDLYQVAADGNQIKVDQIRTLCQDLMATAQQGGRRVAVIQQSEKMNQAAANALLKTLEEPGEGTLLILQSSQPAHLLATISSRCQRLHIPLPSHADINHWLQQQVQVRQDTTWCLPVVGGPQDLADAITDGRYQTLIQLRKDWIESLSSGHLCANLMNIDEKQVSDAHKVLYLVLRQKLLKTPQIDALLAANIVELSTLVMKTCHELALMPNINALGLFQNYLARYNQLTGS